LDENIEDPASLKAIFLDLTENHTAFSDMLSRGKGDHVSNARAAAAAGLQQRQRSIVKRI
jgi:hypothetical protein